MNKLSKIFLGIIILLASALAIMIYEYINLRNIAKANLDSILEKEEELQKAYIRIQELENEKLQN